MTEKPKHLKAMNIQCNSCGKWNVLGSKICDKCRKPILTYKVGF